MNGRQYVEGIGRRKEATARVRLYPGGTGNYLINDKPAAEYLSRMGDLDTALSPLRLCGMEGSFDMSVLVKGGGITGQTDAIKLGVARAILKLDPEKRPLLRHAGLLTRDPRAKERKKPGLRRARKAPTYTKR
ncbi:MAG: 30S ribosomal protein S9 [Candidatus Thermofonsia Clade 1 bacterium]|jgi:small subunit ribosomal protein S9|uniref:Small ribosomal subunit protein uS9 n=1 Tax=Candidatus Thermofonsia Clade 1 bacterium TaxID=2364210 RepID=A0A2M8PIT6_9CHLR|nr:MAG: 30S ribosomal protein S9 [Candidatus Thermofonsia Clade 1 bacterium]PJF42650.1 MAG: 30S ribosomal protein S9 [Candidatus Thermofonsia Clade 1 bacterium]RMF53923.1 MAG: 30S ribosomal protein S9 [Chloroflexota bacterium]